jgi:hypothetical protein
MPTMRTHYIKLSTVLFVITAMVPASKAQQQTPDQSAPPIPAYHSPFASAADNGGDQDTGTQSLLPDTRSPSGAQIVSLGVPATTHSYWQPFVNVSTALDSNPNGGAGGGWTTWTSISGGVDLDRKSGNSDMKLDYLGGGMLSNTGTASNGIIQTLNFTDTLSFRRTTLTFINHVSYLPEAAFGFAGLGSGALPTGGSLSAGFEPAQSILTPRGQDLTNASIIEVNRALTSRTSLTFVGGYSLLHYFDTGSDNGLLNYGDVNFQGGYNDQITRKDTISLIYGYSGFRYSNSDQSMDTHTISVAYSRRVTGRLAFQVTSGPQLVFSQFPVSGTAESANSGTTSQVYWSAQTALQYQLRQAQLGVTYYHGVSGGSGVLAGSLADTLAATASRQLSRTTTGVVDFGFSRNSGGNGAVPTPSKQTYDYWFGGANLSHQLGRTLNVNLSYQAQYQQSNASLCSGPACGTNVIRHLISVGVGWRKQAIPIE